MSAFLLWPMAACQLGHRALAHLVRTLTNAPKRPDP